MHVKVLNQLLVRAYTHKRAISYKKAKFLLEGFVALWGGLA